MKGKNPLKQVLSIIFILANIIIEKAGPMPFASFSFEDNIHRNQ